MKNNIILIGFMGAGKTSVGARYAANENMQFLDTDLLIEEMSGMSISRIFAEQGEEKFRQLETEMLHKLLEDADFSVISTGGGLPLREENRQALRELGTVVFLDVSVETVLERLKGDTKRPLLQGDHVKEKVESLLGKRRLIYRKAADTSVDVNKKSLKKIISELKSFVLSRDCLTEKGVDGTDF